MWKLPDARSESVFEDYKAPYDAQQAAAEASRCLYCYDAPCIKACPTGIDIPNFIRKIATGNVQGSARTIFSANILGASCACVCPVEVLCVGDCVYNAAGIPPIQIGRLQRYATDQAVAANWRFFEAGPDTGKRVALVGAGPASLSAAHELRRHGHAVTIYEKGSVPGGLNVTGVAPYKLRAEDAMAELEWVLGIGGIEFVMNTEIGRDRSWESLAADHDAVFVGIGLGPDRSLPGAALGGVHGAVAWIEQMKLGLVDLSSVRDAVVIGGGNTAVDCVRELLGLGVPGVTMVYRGTEAKMSGYAHEWDAAKKDGARALWNAAPAGFVGEPHVEGVRYTGTEGPGVVPAQLVLLAIGQSKLGDQLAPLGIRAEAGRVVTDATGATSRPGWYVGGDAANGGKEVVNAVAEGKRAATAIHAFISGGGHA
ncbi:MAG: FAD-dependent oxidoreductase [Pseudomonadota bacterium]|nr:FAD-dependent oxidoreductase [Pseudomonadota bacterium]